ISRGHLSCCVSPHPGPLPRGEGERLATQKHSRLMSKMFTLKKARRYAPTLREPKKLAMLLPLPEGEGRGEGEESIQVIDAANRIKMRSSSLNQRIKIARLYAAWPRRRRTSKTDFILCGMRLSGVFSGPLVRGYPC